MKDKIIKGVSSQPQAKTVVLIIKTKTLWLIGSHILTFIVGMIVCWFTWSH